VPFKEDRTRLIEQAHLLGHFGIESTFSRLEEDYYWKNMLNHVQLYIKKCMQCARNKSFTPIEHPAKAIPITGMFERIGMDITGDFPKVDGYYKLLVIKEYLTKFVRVYPLRSKEKEEVAENLWKWISLYGPPKQVLSDQGGEFMNHVMDSLLNKLGIEKRVTSAYSPRTDGCTEKANDTIVTVLRSHAESDHINWIKWISFVEYAYNTRRHSSTNYSPYELLFGIKPNAFVDYRQDLNSKSDEIEDVKARSIQLKNLVSSTRQLAIENIKTAQDKQVNDQNKRFNITTEAIPNGTPVLIKNDGRIGKLEPRYRGHYYIHSQTENGNYKLKDITGEIVKDSFPVNKLKPFLEENQSENHFEIEKILDKRKENNEIQYLVKWKSFSSDHNEWVLESQFSDFKKINEFNNSFYPKDDQQTTPLEVAASTGKRRGRPPKTLVSPNQLPFIMMII